MSRQSMRWAATLAVAMTVLTAAPATSQAGIIPWMYDSIFGPVGSIQMRRAGYYGPSAGYGYGGGTCCNYAPAANCCGGGGLFPRLRRWNNCCSPCGSPCGMSMGCSSCGMGSCGIGGCASGNCASGTCNTFYPPATSNAPTSLTPADGSKSAGPTPTYDSTAPMPNTESNAYGPAVPPADGFRERAAPVPTPMDAVPDDGQFVPPKNNNTPGTGTSGAPSATRPSFQDDDGFRPNTTNRPVTPEAEDKSNAGPRLELHDKVAWQHTIQRTRQTLQPARCNATVVRAALFPKQQWLTPAPALAKK